MSLPRLRALSPAAVDVMLTVLVVAGQSAPFLFTTGRSGQPWTVLQFLPVVLASLPVLWRRRWPVLSLCATALGVATYSVVGGHGPEQPVWFGALLAFYTVADLSPRAIRLVTLAASAVGIVVVGGLLGSADTAIREAFLWGAAYALGRGAHVRRAYARVLEERAAILERERAAEGERATARERARIARDTHDILAHAVSVMVVQAEAGPVVVRAAPDRAVAAFDAIAAAGREAMAQLRRTLGLLTDDTANTADRAPLPAVDRVPELVAGVGPHVTLTTSGTRREPSARVDAAAYRIVQEALTNVVKHSTGDAAAVALEWTAAELVITVRDNGSPPAGTTPGHGLIGIRERAAACGGSASFTAAGDGFRVSARLPLDLR
ncbi:histidine kinase [Actinosynnema sp. NPDC047251]|uniref:histidine kinase n=1 Tax=Saccharothrix espanaensis (strain ATCC 51144 / DSM 44229 / JCM 9112 / NBRC 15066 / NRRL 15764) TaxID=1179773 RepID=K0JZ30_SACES|nr:histidine kinase [Saccharothrix espanaensis]CCH33225.1 Two-component system, sensor histidine kinase [Saccharothrix espanaensis DSM 44229]